MTGVRDKQPKLSGGLEGDMTAVALSLTPLPKEVHF